MKQCNVCDLTSKLIQGCVITDEFSDVKKPCLYTHPPLFLRVSEFAIKIHIEGMHYYLQLQHGFRFRGMCAAYFCMCSNDLQGKLVSYI